MESVPSTCEIVESTEESKPDSNMDKKVMKHFILQSGTKFSLEDDINQLFETIKMRAPSKAIGLSSESSKGGLEKKAMKRPMRVGSPQISGIGICEPVNLKQALRGLCISQASEMAAMKRLSGPSSSIRASEARAIKNLYRKNIVEANKSGFPLNEGNGSLVEISLVPERFASSSCGSSQDRVFPLHTECKSEMPKAENVKLKSADTLPTCLANERSLELVEKTSSTGPKNNLACSTPRFMKPILRNKKKVFQDSLPISSDPDPSKSYSGSSNYDSAIGEDTSMKATPTSSARKNTVECNSSNSVNRIKPVLIKIDERSQLGEKGEFSQSSKSSIGEYSCSTSISEDSTLSGSSRCGYRPHMSRDTRWEAIRSFQRKHRSLSLKDFKLIKKLGCGDIGSVYLAELASTGSLFALKVMDNEFLAGQKKESRAETEREILQMLDHPFLPTLYAHFVSDRFSCLVMEHCPGGDLHVLRQKQPCRSFSEQAARFYAAEVLLALEYLHMLGVVYRDLKPENILVREDGHIMLSDFDLSLRSAGNPIMVQSISPTTEPSNNSCIDPFCLQPSWQVSCFTPQLLCVTARSRKLKPDPTAQVSPLPQLVVEPTNARSNSFVGTHEYLAPEIIKGEGHGSAVDWWTFGIFLFELLYGRTPFKGAGNEETLSNVVSRSLKFPSSPIVSFFARDLIRGLLIKEPENRLGYAKGAAEIKQHAFFDGINWALIRCAVPPERPKFCEKYKECRGKEEYTEFEMF